MIVTLARKPLMKTLVMTIESTSCGAINIDATRIPLIEGENTGVTPTKSNDPTKKGSGGWKNTSEYTGSMNDDWKKGRWGANFILSKSVVGELDKQSLKGGMHSAGHAKPHDTNRSNGVVTSFGGGDLLTNGGRYGDSGGASRFFKVIK